MRSLAAEAGVSAATVSFALRNSREVSRATRDRLQRLAVARGYRPDPHVGKLMHHLRTRVSTRATTNICALTERWPGPRPAPTNYLERLKAGLRARAESLGYTFDVLSLDDYPTRPLLLRVLVSRGIEGLVILPRREPGDLSARLNWSEYSTVAATSSVLAPQFHRVTPNHFDNMIHACQQLTHAGFRRIGLAMSREGDVRVNHRWAGGIAWQNQFGGTRPVAPLIEVRPGPNLDAVTLAAWLAREEPDAVVFETLDRAVLDHAFQTLPARRRPKVVTMNWPNLAADYGIDQRAERIGTVAIEMLAAMITRGEKGVPLLANTMMVDGQWVRAKS